MGHRLSKITTRTGDGGETGLGDGSRVRKDSPRVAALGEIDGQLIGIDEQNHVIEAAVPAHELATVKAIDGVCYVRSVFNYFSAGPALTRAA